MRPSKIINMWAGPRNISTTMMYSFAQRPDMEVVDEPLYAHYLRLTGKIHPGREEVLATYPQDGQEVMEGYVKRGAQSHLFLKNMGQHYLGLEESRFLDKMEHFFLIREPRAVIKSFSKVIAQPELLDIGIRRQWEIAQELRERGQNIRVLDSEDILRNPEAQLRNLCLSLQISFYPQMLWWKEGARPEDGTWAKYWYKNVHQSRGFKPWKAADVSLPPDLEELACEAEYYYHSLKKYRLKPSDDSSTLTSSTDAKI